MEELQHADLLVRHEINCKLVEDLAMDIVCKVDIPIFNTLSALDLDEISNYLERVVENHFYSFGIEQKMSVLLLLMDACTCVIKNDIFYNLKKDFTQRSNKIIKFLLTLNKDTIIHMEKCNNLADISTIAKEGFKMFTYFKRIKRKQYISKSKRKRLRENIEMLNIAIYNKLSENDSELKSKIIPKCKTKRALCYMNIQLKSNNNLCETKTQNDTVTNLEILENNNYEALGKRKLKTSTKIKNKKISLEVKKLTEVTNIQNNNNILLSKRNDEQMKEKIVFENINPKPENAFSVMMSASKLKTKMKKKDYSNKEIIARINPGHKKM